MKVPSALLLALFLVAAPRLGALGATLPKVDHVVIVVEENKTLAQIEGNPHAPYINKLMRGGALFVNAHAERHPSLPNYFALFAGLVNGNGDDCPATGIPANAPNLASELFASHRAFVGYAEAMPSAGFKGCWAGTYARKHVPWVQFSNIPASANLPFSALHSYDSLPAATMIIPDVNDDMHDGTIAMGDAWLAKHIAPLLAWGATHGTLFVLTWDEGFDASNNIPTLFFGPMVQPGVYKEAVDHYTVLRTIEDLLQLPPTGAAARKTAISDCWR
ncbi:MAG TPA: alkaline phosphatase family protein [Candidatus Acidoferrales bacterium]|nr:alkaline phosphatase family protein [Candidatus Acidoferrales bacterium]